MGRFAVTEATFDDLDDIVAIHPRPDTGSSARYHAYYADKVRLFLEHPDSTIFVAKAGSTLVAFAMVTADQRSFNRHCRRPRALLRAACHALTGRYGINPLHLKRCAEWALQHLRLARDRALMADHEFPNAWVRTIETAPPWRRQGAASQLMAAAERYLSKQGVQRVGLYVAEDNAAALKMYERRGYRESARVAKIGEVCLIMTRMLTPDD